MGTSSNFGNMFNAAVASVVRPFLPMLPGQILLNNLLYDTGQLSIPTDRVDPEQLRAPAHWNIAYIRPFMFLFGPISSVFDFATFALMILVFHAAQSEFQAGMVVLYLVVVEIAKAWFFSRAVGQPAGIGHRRHTRRARVTRRAARPQARAAWPERALRWWECFFRAS